MMMGLFGMSCTDFLMAQGYRFLSLPEGGEKKNTIGGIRLECAGLIWGGFLIKGMIHTSNNNK